MPANHSTSLNSLAATLHPVKGARLVGDRVSGRGYLFGGDGADDWVPVRHSLDLNGRDPFAFIFGLSGIGYHYQLDIRPDLSILALYQIRDGIPLYLHHFANPLFPFLDRLPSVFSALGEKAIS